MHGGRWKGTEPVVMLYIVLHDLRHLGHSQFERPCTDPKNGDRAAGGRLPCSAPAAAPPHDISTEVFVFGRAYLEARAGYFTRYIKPPGITHQTPKRKEEAENKSIFRPP
jgi:hypothetical protein